MIIEYLSKIYHAITGSANRQAENPGLEQEIEFYRNLSRQAKARGHGGLYRRASSARFIGRGPTNEHSDPQP